MLDNLGEDEWCGVVMGGGGRERVGKQRERRTGIRRGVIVVLGSCTGDLEFSGVLLFIDGILN
jgi:hypothetical protein